MSASIRLVPPETLGLKPVIGLAALTRLAFRGADLNPLWTELVHRLQADSSDVEAAMDLSLIAQLLGQPELGLGIQEEALSVRRLYRSPGPAKPRLTLLAFAAAADMGSNTPLEFLLETSEIALYTLYVVPGQPLLEELPEHDVAIVAVPYSEATRVALKEIERLTYVWPRPVLNRPRRIMELERDRLFALLSGVEGLYIPPTGRADRDDLEDILSGEMTIDEVLKDGAYPLIIRPIGSQAGKGLQRLFADEDLASYLETTEATDFFLSPYIAYASDDGLFRKYRVAFVGGVPYACHMAVAAEWKLWYLNAGMGEDAAKRAEEEAFMGDFDTTGFGARHRAALDAIASRTGLDYFAIDCAETRDGKLLVFEADIASIIHDMDPPEVYPYKHPQMQKIFTAFAALVEARAETQAAA